MKVDKQEVWIVDEEPGWKGMLRHIEKCGRVSWKSESRITEDSYEKFIEFLYNKGHWAVFNLGTAYLKVPVTSYPEKLVELYKEPWTRIIQRGGNLYITTNYRVLCQLGIRNWLKDYWEGYNPEFHHKRVTVGWYCSRVISEEILRHRAFSPVKESTRYVNYNKFGDNNIHFILPQYAYQVRDEVAQTISPVTGGYQWAWIKNQDGEELWEALVKIHGWAEDRNTLWKDSEEQYFREVKDYKVAPEIARGVLPLDLACTFYTTGYLGDFFYKPSIDSPEKAGFFNLRTDKAAHRDLRAMAIELEKEMIKREYDIDWKKFEMSLV